MWPLPRQRRPGWMRYPASERLPPRSSSPSRVGPPHCCGDPPSEPCVPLVAAHGSSKPRGRRGVRCWQPASTSLKLAVAGGVCQVGSTAAQPISLVLVGEIVGSDGPADDVQPPVLPLPSGLRSL